MDARRKERRLTGAGGLGTASAENPRDGGRGAQALPVRVRHAVAAGGPRPARAMPGLRALVLSLPLFAAGAGAALAPALATMLVPGPAAAQSGGAQAAQIQALGEEVRRLTGRVQELEAKIDRIARDGGQRINDLDYRLTMQEGGDAGMVGDPVALGGIAAALSAGAPPVAVSEKLTLEQAETALANDDPTTARKLVGEFLEQNPSGPLTPRARFILGRSLSELGETRSAAQIYLGYVQSWPQGPDAPESLLRLGSALAALNKGQEACLTLAEVAKRYPDASELVGAADAERQRIGCR